MRRRLSVRQSPLILRIVGKYIKSNIAYCRKSVFLILRIAGQCAMIKSEAIHYGF